MAKKVFTLEVMSLRDEILSAPRGTKAEIERKTGLSKPTVLNAVNGVACGPKAAQAIAAAFGQPDRWRELLPDPPALLAA